MHIRGKLVTGYFLIALLTAVVGLIGIQLTGTINNQLDGIATGIMPDIEILQELRSAGMQIVASTIEYQVVADIGEKGGRGGAAGWARHEEERIAAGIALYEASAEDYYLMARDGAPAEISFHRKIRERGDSLIRTSAGIVAALKGGAQAGELRRLYERFEEDERAYLAAIDEAMGHEKVLFGKHRLQLGNQLASVNRQIAGFAFLTFAVALLAGMGIASYISRGIVRLKDAAEVIGAGDLETRIDIHTEDEIGELAGTFNRMTADLKRSRDEVVKARDYLNDIIHSMMDSLIVASPDGTVLRVNAATCTLLGYDVEPVGLPLSAIMPATPFPELVEKGVIQDAEKVYLTKDGRQVPVAFSGSVIWDPDGSMQGIVCVARDITERKQAGEKLRRFAEEVQETNEDLRNFTHIVSHDLRSPLVNIRGFSGELTTLMAELEELLGPLALRFPAADKVRVAEIIRQEVPEALGFINSSVNRMDMLIAAVLKLSRLGRRELVPERIEVREVVERILHSLAHQLEARQVTVELCPLPAVVEDLTAVEQIFGNLLENAVKYLDPERPGLIAISCEEQPDELIFHIRDNGRGIAPQDREKVFEIFRRAGTQDVPGEGTGLAYVKALVRRLGGRIWYASLPGEGTVFSFAIPQRSAAPG